MVQGNGLRHTLWQAKWVFYNTRLNPYATRLNKDTFNVAQQIIVLSKRLKEHLMARGIAERKVHVIPPGAPEVTSSDRDDALRESWGWVGKRIVCQFGFVAPAKGHLQALNAFAQLPEDYVYLIAGGTRLESHSAFVDQIKERSRMLGISHRVHITGFLAESEIARHIASSDVLIFPNTQVDFSYSLVTAIAHRSTPIIASDLYAHREVASECEGVALYKAGDPAQLAGEIMRVCSDEAKRRKMINGLKAYAQSHTWRKTAEQTRQVYELALTR